MRILTAAAVIGPLMLAGTLAAAGPSNGAGSSAPVRLAAESEASADKENYSHAARDEVQEWRRKVNAFGADAAAEGKVADRAARDDLNKAWIKAQDASRQLEVAGAEGWESAKASYKEASGELAAVWRKLHSDSK